MSLKIRKLQRNNQSVLLLIHDRSGRSHELIERVAAYLSEMLQQESYDEPEPERPTDSDDK